MDPPDHRHMRSLLNKAFTPRAIQSQRETVVELVEHYLGKADPDNFDVVQDFSGPFPVEVITRMAGVPEDIPPAGPALDRHGPASQAGPDRARRRQACRPTSTPAMYYYGLVQERRDEPAGRHDQPADRRRDRPTRTARLRKLDDIEITGFATLLGGAGAETVTKLVGNAVVVFAQTPRPVAEAARRPQQDSRPRSRSCCATTAPSQYNVRYSVKDVELHGGTIPAGKPVFLIGGSANRDPRAFDDADTFDIDRDRTQAQNLGLGYGIHSCLGAALARMESAIALEQLLDFMPRYEVDFDGCRRVHMQNVAGYHHVP